MHSQFEPLAMGEACPGRIAQAWQFMPSRLQCNHESTSSTCKCTRWTCDLQGMRLLRGREPERPQKARRPSERGDAFAQALSLLPAARSDPVSYTHLTLPTICSV
eukprot:13550091-Alexandrium_andersonii.AAC.1